MQSNHYATLVESLQALASESEYQKEMFPNFVDVAYEIISSFENVFLLLPQIIRSGDLSYDSIAKLIILYNNIQWCSRNVGLDDFTNIKWLIVKDLSKEALESMNNPLNNLDIS